MMTVADLAKKLQQWPGSHKVLNVRIDFGAGRVYEHPPKFRTHHRRISADLQDMTDAEMARKYGVSRQTVAKWRRKVKAVAAETNRGGEELL